MIAQRLIRQPDVPSYFALCKPTFNKKVRTGKLSMRTMDLVENEVDARINGFLRRGEI
jgi:hypothetical protein